jgi:hypothetical protein
MKATETSGLNAGMVPVVAVDGLSAWNEEKKASETHRRVWACSERSADSPDQ